MCCALFVTLTAHASAFCDCCCNALAGTATPCPGCDLDGNGSVSVTEVNLLGCATDPICAAILPAPTATPTQTACVGDCDGSGDVTINELLTMVNVALGNVTVTACPAGDKNGDGDITIDEILGAVINALGSCPVQTPPPSLTPTIQPSATVTPVTSAIPTATVPFNTPSPTNTALPSVTPTTTVQVTPSATPTPSPTMPASLTPSQTNTPSPGGTPGNTGLTESVAGGAVVVANGMAAIPAVVTALVSGLQSGSSASASEALPFGVDSTSGACPLGGTATRACSGGFGNVTLTITLTTCQVPTASGSLTVDGTITLQAGGFSNCPSLILPPWTATLNVQATFKNAAGTDTLLTAAASLTGTVSPQLGGSCFATGADLVLSGTLDTTFPGQGNVHVGFTNTHVGIAVSNFNAQCVPVKYVLTFNGPATLSTALAGSKERAALSDALMVTFNAFAISQDASASPTTTQMNGGITAACFGGAITLQTVTGLTQLVGEACPSGGSIKLSAAPGQSQIFYLPGGAVGLDTNLDGSSEETFPSCLDARLHRCAGQPGPSVTPNASATRTTTGLPSATPSLTSVQPPSPTPTPTGQPTLTTTPTPPATASATRTASPTPTPTGVQTLFCDSLSQPALIPDNDPAGITNTILLSNPTLITDLNVRLDVTHPYVGDLVVTLTHLDSHTSTVRLIDRPGLATLGNGGCSGHDISATLDDAATSSVQDACDPGDPTIFGRLQPENPLSAFNGDAIEGAWQLNISDNAPNDVGSLLGWCLEINAPPSPPPVITAFTCQGSTQCTLPIGQPFVLSFSFTDADGNATAWRMRAVRGDGMEFSTGSGTFAPPVGSATVPVSFTGFNCSQPPCSQSEFDFFLVVLDATNQESAPASLHITVLASS